jgi:hypothetical protein
LGRWGPQAGGPHAESGGWRDGPQRERGPPQAASWPSRAGAAVGRSIRLLGRFLCALWLPVPCSPARHASPCTMRAARRRAGPFSAFGGLLSASGCRQGRVLVFSLVLGSLAGRLWRRRAHGLASWRLLANLCESSRFLGLICAWTLAAIIAGGSRLCWGVRAASTTGRRDARGSGELHGLVLDWGSLLWWAPTRGCLEVLSP